MYPKKVIFTCESLQQYKYKTKVVLLNLLIQNI